MFKLVAGLLAAGKLGKVLFSGGTMLLSMFAYALVFGWRYAVGFVLLIFIHECGHFLAARQRGLAVSLPAFIPFVGAWIQLKDQPHDAETEAWVGFAGPLLGSAAALVCYWLARQTGRDLLMALAYAGFMLNLFNLIPISPLDGGRITAVISPKVWLAGVPLLAALFLWRPSPMLILIGLLAWPHLKTALGRGEAAHPPGYFEVPAETRVNYAVMYLGLVGFLALMSYTIHETLGAATGT